MFPLRWLSVLGLLALVSVAVFWAGRREVVVVLSAVSVLVIVGSLWLMFTPSNRRADG